MSNSGACTKARAYCSAFSAAEQQSESAAHGAANRGILSGLLTLTRSANPNNTAMHLVIADTDQLKIQIAPSLQLSGGVHIDEPDVRRGSLWHHGSVVDHDRRAQRPSKHLTRLVIVRADTVDHDHWNHGAGRDRQCLLSPACSV